MSKLKEVIFGSKDPDQSRQLGKLLKDGAIRKIAPRIYSPNFEDSEADIIRRNLFTVLGNLFPGAVLSHRSAFEFKPTRTGQIFITYSYTRKTELPGVTLRFLEGSGPIEGDNPLSGELYVSQRARAFLENFQLSRKSGADSKTLSIPEIEAKLEQILQVNGEEELNKVRDEARKIAKVLKMEKEFKALNDLISAMLSTKPADILTSPVAKARAFGVPYDVSRIELFEKLFIELKQREFKYRPEQNTTIQSFRNFAFFESYFSNYIEGTVFSLSDAREIISTQTPIPTRYGDSHDILGTYQIVSNRKEMARIPATPEELVQLLLNRHKILLSARTEKRPGAFKERDNFAGNTSFVSFKLVRGTLIKCFDYYQALVHPFAKAAFIMFTISEIHPFEDGNGRIARVMMNAELVKGNQSKIIIPTVYRDDYLITLRKLTRHGDPGPYLKMLSRAHEFSEIITGNSQEEMQQLLEKSNAFLESEEGRLKIISEDQI